MSIRGAWVLRGPWVSTVWVWLWVPLRFGLTLMKKLFFFSVGRIHLHRSAHIPLRTIFSCSIVAKDKCDRFSSAVLLWYFS